MPIGDKKGGFIRPGYDPLEVPNEPTSVAVSSGDSSLDVSFTAPVNTGGGAVTGYQATTTTGASGTGASSPVTITGLTNGVSYDVRVWALNAYGPGPFGTGSGTPEQVLAAFASQSDFSNSNLIDYVSVSTLSNASDWGDLASAIQAPGGCASTTRGIFGGGATAASSGAMLSTVQFITWASTGNTTSFGNLTTARFMLSGLNSATRGVFCGGSNGSGTQYNTMDYITMSSSGTAAGFGSLTTTAGGFGPLATSSSSTRGIIGGGYYANIVSGINYITIASTGNATSFGTLTGSYGTYMAGCSSATRSLFFGGSNFGIGGNDIQYVTIATTGNSTDFGDLLSATAQCQASSSPTRGVFNGGTASTNVIQYITIATTGNAADFGDLTTSRVGGTSVSSGNGGLQ